MSVIHVLEVRYAPTKDGPWTEWEQLGPINVPPADYRPKIDPFEDRYRQVRIVPYLRVDKRPGSEHPADRRNVLGCWGGYWHVAHWSPDSGEWEQPRDDFCPSEPPDYWVELPPAEEQPR